ncbi:MAG: polysaccharide biosynthesis protein [Clostridiales bacterium]|jgi:stage V sporulation protein B|nr:polysaccharide biosynthesis protein [Eubacteriales bacterium]NLO16132.1 polysaccharide biosynthesis protein [Clostridiales bacterium]
MTDRQHSLAKGISILGIAGLICKIVGVLYKIPLAQTIGPMGMGVYHQVFPTYNLLLTLSSAGIPVAISRMVAGYLATDDKRSARQVFSVSITILAVLGLMGMLLMLALSPSLAALKGTPDADKSFMAIAPSLLFVSLLSAFRGFMQGRRRMVPTAVSQLIEQVGKVFVALPFAVLGMQRGGFVMGAAGALLGTSVAEAAALIYMMFDYRAARAGFAALPDSHHTAVPSRTLARELIMISVPITIGACIVPIAGEVDSVMLVRMMKNYLPDSEALIRYGTYTGLVFPLINVPTALAMATATNLVPSISGAFEKKDYPRIARESGTGMRIASVIGFPSAIGLSLLAEPILVLLFSGDQYTLAQLRTGARLLEISALTIALFTMVQTTSGILQGLHRQRIPMITLALGVGLKILLNYTLVRVPAINIHGAPFASILCYFASMVPNLYYVAKYGRMKLDVRDLLLRPLAASLAMALAVWGLKMLLGDRLSTHFLWMLVTIVVAIVIYFVAARAFKAIKEEDLPARFRRKKGNA